ncbi:MAG: ATP-binding protein [Gammaproteobacteria bacterium]|nr:ATP-binding protein [Gammaproteobacteria bacterium]
MLEREAHLRRLAELLEDSPVVAMIGARQVGKTTLARELVKQYGEAVHVFDLESSEDLARLADPMLALSSLGGLVVLDEVQRRPELFPTLRVLADRRPLPARFLVLGSASPALLRQSSETLAGRIAHYELPGFTLAETGAPNLPTLWLRGGFPASFTARSDAASVRWRRNFATTFLQRDIAQFGISIPGATLERFWAMLAHCHAQIWNGSELARAFGVSNHAVKRYLDALESTFMVRSLKPWSANLAKRQVKSPKVYVRDSGLLHRLLDIDTSGQLERHPKLGASWEGFIIEQIIQALDADERRCHFWAAHTGGEIDLLIQSGGKLRGFEVKRTSSPAVTRPMRNAFADLELDSLDVIHAGRDSFPLAKGIRAIAAQRMLEDLA